MIYVWHHAVALLGSLALSAAVHGRPWTRSHPRQAVVLWHLIIFTATTSLIGLLVTLALQGLGLGVIPALGAAQTIPLSVPQLGALLAATAVVAVGAGVQLSATISRSRTRARHRALLDIVGDISHPRVTVIPHPGIAIYTVPGRSPRIVATSGALDRLSSTELDAVLAHEDGHLDGRHDLALFPFSALRKGFPRSRVIAAAEDEVALLLELCADTHAVRRGYREPLLSAMAQFSAAAGQLTIQPCTRSALGIRRENLLTTPTSRPATLLVLFATNLTLSLTSLSLYLLPV